MIGKLQGEVDFVGADWMILMVGGVGYRVFVPATTLAKLAPEEKVALYIHTHVREDAMLLYGFPSREEQELFETLITVTGVGPKLALSILSRLAPDQLVGAILQKDTKVLTQVPGVGRKTADRLILELKDRVKGWQLPEGTEIVATPVSTTGSLADDVIDALIQLGYPSEAGRRAVEVALAAQPDANEESLLRAALKHLQSL